MMRFALIGMVIFLWVESAFAISNFCGLASPYDLVKDEEYFAFVPRLRDGRYLPRVVRTRSYFLRDMPFVTQLVTVETRPELVKDASLIGKVTALAKKGEEAFRKDIVSWVNFALEQFGRRDWTESFKAKLLQFAQDYAHRSTYIIIRERVGRDGVGKILGTLRLISSSYYGESVQGKGGKSEIRVLDPGVPLPEEVYLKTMLPRTWSDLNLGGSSFNRLVGGEILEPGNYAILRGVGENIEKEILALFLSLLVSPSHGGIILSHNRQLYTYGDQTSVRLYKGKGFHPAEGIPTVFEDGTEWTVLEASVETFVAAQQLLARTDKKSQEYWKNLRESLGYFLNTETRRQ